MTVPRLLPEIEAAALAGFRRWRDFQRARRLGLFPRPDVELPDGPRWSETHLRVWIEGRMPRDESSREEAIVRRIEQHAAAAAFQRQGAAGR